MFKKSLIKRLNPLVLNGIAHRGLHNESLTENGLKAFKNALDNNLAIELDVHLTKDNLLIVCHDESLLRTTGKEGIIEDLTSKEIRENYRLKDGGVVPTFKEVLDLVNEQVPIFVELKVYLKNYKLLAKRLKEELKGIKDKNNIILISFDPRSLFPFFSSGYKRMLLCTPSHGWTYVFRHVFNGMDLDQAMLKEKKYQKCFAHHFVNVWTIETKEQFEAVYPYVDTVTFQNLDYKYVVSRLKEKQQSKKKK